MWNGLLQPWCPITWKRNYCNASEHSCWLIPPKRHGPSVFLHSISAQIGRAASSVTVISPFNCVCVVSCQIGGALRTLGKGNKGWLPLYRVRQSRSLWTPRLSCWNLQGDAEHWIFLKIFCTKKGSWFIDKVNQWLPVVVNVAIIMPHLKPMWVKHIIILHVFE
jgi:hypothetical protein